MAIKIDEKYMKQVNSIMSKLPQNPFIIDVVGKAIEICAKYTPYTDNLDSVLELADATTEYVSKYSSATSYKYALIVAPLLVDIPYDKYEVIDTASGTVKEYVEAFSDLILADGWKNTWIQLNNLVKKDPDLLYPALYNMVQLLEIMTKQETLSINDKYQLAGMAYIEVSLRKSAITIPNRQYELYNKFMGLIMKKAQF